MAFCMGGKKEKGHSLLLGRPSKKYGHTLLLVVINELLLVL